MNVVVVGHKVPSGRGSVVNVESGIRSLNKSAIIQCIGVLVSQQIRKLGVWVSY